MNRICFYLVILLLTLSSCKSSEDKKNHNSERIVSPPEVIDRSNQEQSFLKKKVLGSNLIKRDTTINNYHISYVVQDNDDVIATYPIVDGKGLDTVNYAGREVLLDIRYLKSNILQKKIDRNFFNSYIPKKELEKYSIYYFRLDKVDNADNVERIFFDISLCIPETDICYWFELSVSNKGDIEIKDTTLEGEEDL